MKKINKKYLYIFLVVLMFIPLSGCSKIDNLKVKMGLKNNDFDYMTENKVDKIVIQSNRDPRFRFVVTDKGTIQDLNKILSEAKVANEKTSLEPDYIFEIHQNDETVIKFNYVVGLQEKKQGNFYNDDKAYVVSKRIDNDIIRNLSTLTKPRKFEELYYDTILKFIDKYGESFDTNKKIGVNISDDVEVLKYVLSTDLEYFKDRLNDKLPNAEVVNKNKNDFDILVNVKTYGYKTTIYKSIITLQDKSNNTENKYYVLCNYEDNSWSIDVSKEKPEGF
ncbi:hypothetical protein [Clostridium frigidicarnis]|uniref:YhfM-like domain-containing protein n=1 Tax=Clostridium frigidicarnis TaxID=84698 RepID=A0A1I0YNH7_9CLOT|nr:hypothetical protein [Clostridium frigidicarnis]SFB14771.1 hypothetical protein SAMN04488528_101436 [Clostridium frigidicarnis]